MSVAAKKWVRKHSPARGSRRMVLLELAWDGDEAGRGARLSTEQLVKATGLSRSTVKRALAELEAGQLIVRHRGGPGHCDSCAAARRGAHVFDVVIHDEVAEAFDPNQMSLLNGVVVDQVQNVDQVHGGPGSWSRVTQQEEVEDGYLSLDQVEETERPEEHLPLDEAESQRPAREAARTRPVTYRGRTVPREIVAQADRLLAAFNDAAGTQLGARKADGRGSDALKQIAGALIDRPDEHLDVWERGVRAMIADPPSWIDGRIMIGHLFGPRAAEHTLTRGRGDQPAIARVGAGRGLSASQWGAIADDLEAQEAAA